MRVASYYIGRGFSVDLGLMQINSRNLAALGLPLPMAFDTCSNLHGGAVILTANYLGAAATYGPGLTALQVALSLYNTGTRHKGFNNGYVARYFPPGTFAVPVVACARDLPRKAAAAGAYVAAAPG